MFGLTPYRGRRGLSRRWMFDFDRMFEDMLDEMDFRLSSYYPMKVDIKERDDRYLLEAELPGVNKEDINIEIKNDIMTISVERKEVFQEERENYIKRERRYGSFRRSFPVDDVDQDKIEARFENGVLYMELPKKKDFGGKSNRIQIK
ncbi:MAG TPA: Hsp20/alpha crystallin family protein [Tissierellia bacterium]|nr:Hsp20/alpha crystallin family protein [Tissierellia bacterium]